MMKLSYKLITVFAALVLTIGCTKDDLAYDVIESPVLAVFESIETTDDAVNVTAIFYDLDKSGILDYQVGIDSIPVSGLNISVFVDTDVLIDEVTTDANGVAILSADRNALNGSRQLEWVGNYENTPFRILKKF